MVQEQVNRDVYYHPRRLRLPVLHRRRRPGEPSMALFVWVTILTLRRDCYTQIYRCYVVWQRRAVVILMPVVFFCGYAG